MALAKLYLNQNVYLGTSGNEGYETCLAEVDHDEYTVPEGSTAGYTDWSNHITTYEGGADIELGGLLDDLGWEFCCEMHRRQDLIRFKMKDGRNVWNGKSWFCKDATTSDHWNIFAIPNDVMKANVDMKQNPGYSGGE